MSQSNTNLNTEQDRNLLNFLDVLLPTIPPPKPIDPVLGDNNQSGTHTDNPKDADNDNDTPTQS